VVAIPALVLGGSLVGTWMFAPPQVASRQMDSYRAETTGSANWRDAQEREIDLSTGAPLTHLGRRDLVSGSQALIYPAQVRPGAPQAPSLRAHPERKGHQQHRAGSSATNRSQAANMKARVAAPAHQLARQ